MDKETLDKIIADHQHYLVRDVEGWENMWADLSNANLAYHDLSGVNLKGANLRNANLCAANLGGTNLTFADLTLANLHHADLTFANLHGAELAGTNLSGTRLTGANLCGAIFNKTEMFRKGVILSEGITGWKKCQHNVIVELEIPKGAVVFGINGNKYRTNKCKVISVSNGYYGISMFDEEFTYEVGKEIEVENFNMEYNIECGRGIHFFKTREDAENY